jgi:uncharacterized protein (TIGR03086 family)
MSAEMLDTLDDIYANANRLVAGVGTEQWELPTPCTEWDVRQLVNHMAGSSKVCAAAASRGSRPSGDDHLGDAPVASFASAARQAQLAWRAEGATEGQVSIPADMPAIAALAVNILDIGTHSWDLATATGQDHGLNDRAIETIDQWNRRVVNDDVRAGRGFGDDLGPQGDDRLANMLAFVGRKAG